MPLSSPAIQWFSHGDLERIYGQSCRKTVVVVIAMSLALAFSLAAASSAVRSVLYLLSRAARWRHLLVLIGVRIHVQQAFAEMQRSTVVFMPCSYDAMA